MKSKLSKEKTAERPAVQNHLDIEAILKEKYAPPAEPKPPVLEVEKAAAAPKNALPKSNAATKPAAAESKKLKPASARSGEQKTMKTASAPRITKTARPVGQGAPKKRDTVRVSVDFPRALYEQVVERSDAQAQTLREFLLGLVRANF